jgi:hypothetical protein
MTGLTREQLTKGKKSLVHPRSHCVMRADGIGWYALLPCLPKEGLAEPVEQRPEERLGEDVRDLAACQDVVE